MNQQSASFLRALKYWGFCPPGIVNVGGRVVQKPGDYSLITRLCSCTLVMSTRSSSNFIYRGKVKSKDV
jgi:hypothetical protein